MPISFFSHWSFQYFYFCLTNHSKTMWNEATTLSYSQFWEPENWVGSSKSSMFLIQSDWEYQVLEIAGDFWSFHSNCQTGTLTLPRTSLLELECPNSFFIHMSGARAGESLIARADQTSLSLHKVSPVAGLGVCQGSRTSLQVPGFSLGSIPIEIKAET